jgi:hypothetical protein
MAVPTSVIEPGGEPPATDAARKQYPVGIETGAARARLLIMRYTLPLLLLLSWSPLAAAQVQVDASPWAPGGGLVRVAPQDLGRTPLAEKPAPLRKAHSHLHPGDAQRRQDERDVADELAAQQSANAEAAQSTLKLQREFQNQQFSNEIQADHDQRDRAVIDMQLSQPQVIMNPPPSLGLRAR